MSSTLPVDDERPITPLTTPADGVGPVVDTAEALATVVAAFAAGDGPVAADAERASGYRYGQRTYLIQLRRQGAGTALIDPTAVPDLSSLADAVAGSEWVLHAASQDLPGLAEHGLMPARIFDTELAARLLGMERVGLAAIVAQVLGLGLAKEHSAVDWSTRPLPADWLTYAALDVEVLIPLRSALADQLDHAGKTDWAAEEFEAVRRAGPPAPRVEPWRRTSGLHTIRDRRRLAVVRSLWYARDLTARRRDIAPGRVLPDRAIVAAAEALPRSVAQLLELRPFAGKATQRRAPAWQRAIDEAMALPESALPPRNGPRSDSPPPPRSWPERNAPAAARLDGARTILSDLSERMAVPTENLLQPDALRRLCWSPPVPADPASIGDFLAERGARRWQIGLVAGPFAEAFAVAGRAPEGVDNDGIEAR